MAQLKELSTPQTSLESEEDIVQALKKCDPLTLLLIGETRWTSMRNSILRDIRLYPFVDKVWTTENKWLLAKENRKSKLRSNKEEMKLLNQLAFAMNQQHKLMLRCRSPILQPLKED